MLSSLTITTQEIDTLNEKAWSVNRTDPKKSFELSNQALAASRELNYKKGITHALASLGASNVWLSNYDEALKHLFEARSQLRDAGNKVMEAQVVYQIFCAFYFLNDLDKALEYAQEILILADINNDLSAKANAYNGIGTIFYTLGNSKKAIENLSLGLEIASNHEDKHLLARILDGLGTSYFIEKNYDKAIEYKERSLEAARSSGIKNVEGFALNGLALIYTDKGDLHTAHDYFKSSLAVRKEIEFKTGIAETLLHLGNLYLELKQPALALEALNESLSVVNEVESKEYRYKVHESLSKYYESQKDLDNFKKHFLLFFSSKEEYTNEQHRQKLKSTEMQMRMTQMEKEKESLELKHKELEAYSRDLELLSNLGKKITSFLTIESINTTVYEILTTIMDVHGFGIGILSPETNSIFFPGYMEDGQVEGESHDDLNDENRLSAVCFNQDKEILIRDFETDFNLYLKVRPKPSIGKEVSSIIYLPLKMEDKKIGVMTVQSFNKNAYSDYHVNLIRNLGIYCAIAIENAKLYETLEDKIAERTKEVTQQKEQLYKSYQTTHLLSEIGQQLTSSTNFENIFQMLYSNVEKLMNTGSFGVRLYRPERNEIEYRFEIEHGKVETEIGSVSMDNDNNYSVWCVKNKEVIFINDNIAEHKKYVKEIHVVSGDMPHSLIFYPLMIAERIIGVITVQSFERNAYKPHHVDILKTLGSYTAIALENANLIENLEVRVKERTTELEKQKEEIEKTYTNTKLLSELGKDITAQLSIEKINEVVYEKVNKLMNAEGFGIGIYNEKENTIAFPGYIESGKRLDGSIFKLTETNRLSVVAFNSGDEILINDFDAEHSKYIKKNLAPKVGKSVNSLIYLPVHAKNKKIGVITVQSFENNSYTDYHFNILKSLAVYVGIALDNASLYEHMEEKVEERTAEIDKAYQDTKLLGQISKDISSSLSVETIIEKVYSNINTLMDATAFGIGIFHPETERILMPGFIEKGVRMEDFSYNVNDDRLAPWCFRNQKEIIISNYAKEYKNYIKGIQTPVSGQDSTSIVYLPLFLKDKITGVITVQSFEENVYTEYHIDILRSLATSIASALENARLYESMEEKVRERTHEVVKQKEQIEKTFANTKLISEIGKEISATLSVEKIISKVYENVNSLMDATIFGIGLHRPENKDLLFEGVMEKGEELPVYHYKLEEEKIATRCFNKNEEIVINDWAKEYKKYVAKDYDAAQGDMPESMIYMPIISKNKLIGVMTVQSFEKNAYSNYHTDIMRSLAVYIGSAIENANLYQGLEERVKERTQEIDKAYQDTKLLGQISKEISASLSVETIVEAVYKHVNSLMDAASFGIGIYNPENSTLHFPGFIEAGKKLENVSFGVDDDRLACWCFRNQSEIYTNNYPADYHKYVKTIKRAVAGLNSMSVIYVPLFSKENIIGVLTIQSYHQNAYSEYHMDILRSLSHSIATAMDNAILYSSMEEKVNIRTAEVVKQKEIIEEKNKHITDSIIYAKRIQEAILPPEEVFCNYLHNSFVLYKPKDIVSGDFYWIERKEKKILFAVVDCTGHGVPGAFMSIIGFNGLNQIVNEYNITNPAEILNQLNKIITNTLRQKQEETKIRDGMDISICCIDLENNKMEFAGANNPIFIIRNGNVIEVVADHHPIGNFIGEDEFKFTNKDIDLFPNDRIYLASDGYADQFGGPRGKKLKYTQFRELLLQNHDKPMKEQKEQLDRMFEDWRGDLEQIDDVCVIGIGI